GPPPRAATRSSLRGDGGAPGGMQSLAQELDRRRIRQHPILQLRDLMALVLETDEIGRTAELAQAVDHLLGFGDRDPRIVGAVNQQQWRPDAIEMIDRRDRLEEVAVVLQRPVFGLTQVPPMRAGRLQERDEVADADEAHARGP